MIYLSPATDEYLTFGNGHCDFAWDKDDNVCEMLFGGEMTHTPGTLYDEYVNILSELDQIAIPMSGGVDSEVIAEACVREGIEFRPCIMRYMIGGVVMNTHDIQYAELFCEEHDIYPGYYDLEIEEFLDSKEFWNIAKWFYCVSPQLACHLWMLSKLKEFTAVIPGDFMYVANNSLSVNVFKYNAYDFYLEKSHQRGVAKILSHTPEIIAASIKVQEQIKHKSFNSNYLKKCELYKLGGFNVKPRPAKYTGFEEILKYYQKKYNGEHLYDIFNSRYRKPLEAKIQQPQHIHVWVNDELQEYINEYTKA